SEPCGELDLAIRSRNLRLRAWQACGVPVVGGWHALDDGEGAELLLTCMRCDNTRVRVSSRLPDLEAERQHFARQWLWLCTHLAPLLEATRRGEDPPEVVALYELSLLAGEL